MKHTETDSGSEFQLGARTSDVDVSRADRLREAYHEFVYKPGVVAWEDVRTRIGGLIMLAYVFAGTVGVLLYEAPKTNQDPRGMRPLGGIFSNPGDLARPEWTVTQRFLESPLGSTGSGEDVLAMAIHAIPEMLVMILAGGIFATAIAVFIGTVAGYKGGGVDRVMTTVSDIAMSIPGLPLILVLAVVFSPKSPAVIGVLITVNYWAGLARSIRSQVLTIREHSYVEASRTMGASTPHIILKDVIPNIMPFVLVNFAMAARYVVFASVGLYYLGVLPTSVDNWGIQLNNAYKQAGALSGGGTMYQLLVPMVAIMGIALALILLAQGMDRVFNPRVRTRLAGESESTTDSGDDDAAPTEVMT